MCQEEEWRYSIVLADQYRHLHSAVKWKTCERHEEYSFRTNWKKLRCTANRARMSSLMSLILHVYMRIVIHHNDVKPKLCTLCAGLITQQCVPFNLKGLWPNYSTSNQAVITCFLKQHTNNERKMIMHRKPPPTWRLFLISLLLFWSPPPATFSLFSKPKLTDKCVGIRSILFNLKLQVFALWNTEKS